MSTFTPNPTGEHMQTLKNTPYQTITGNAAALTKLATWYATTAAAETLETGKQTRGDEAAFHMAAAADLSKEAQRLQMMATHLERYLASRREAETKPSIEKVKK